MEVRSELVYINIYINYGYSDLATCTVIIVNTADVYQLITGYVNPDKLIYILFSSHTFVQTE